MYTLIGKRALSTLALAIFGAVLCGTSVHAQYADGYQINVVQQQIRARVVNELRGSNHEFLFDNNAVVRPSGIRDQNTVSGTGRHRYERTGWRAFTYEGRFNQRTGQVVSAIYNFNEYPGGGGYPTPGQPEVGMTWSGRVDAVVRVRLVGRQAYATTTTGQQVSNIRYNFNRDLPRRNLNITVQKREGRGTVFVVQHPNALNGYSAIIEISDPRGGADQYSFDVLWDDFGGGGGGGRPPVSDGQMTWRGTVDATVQVTIRGRNATTRTISGRTPTSVSSNFQDNLPRRAVNVSVRKTDGRGDVRVIQQPSRLNGFAAVVEISDPRGGDDRYGFELSWEGFGGPGGGGNDDDEAGMTWTGRVDGTARVTIRGRNATVREVQTSVQPDYVSYEFFDDLPRRATNVRLRVLDGRGSVRLISEPSQNNGYTAVVEISDQQSGSDFYTFELDWNGRGGGRPPAQEGRLNWRGSVDAIATITISGRSAIARAVTGQAVTSVRYDFSEPLPRRAVTVNVDKREGRGEVIVIQQPSFQNNFTAIVEIRDRSGGRDTYEFDLYW